jgi:hypothetical protein
MQSVQELEVITELALLREYKKPIFHVILVLLVLLVSLVSLVLLARLVSFFCLALVIKP